MAISSLLGWRREDRIDKRLVLEAEGQIAACRRLDCHGVLPLATTSTSTPSVRFRGASERDRR